MAISNWKQNNGSSIQVHSALGGCSTARFFFFLYNKNARSNNVYVRIYRTLSPKFISNHAPPPPAHRHSPTRWREYFAAVYCSANSHFYGAREPGLSLTWVSGIWRIPCRRCVWNRPRRRRRRRQWRRLRRRRRRRWRWRWRFAGASATECRTRKPDNCRAYWPAGAVWWTTAARRTAQSRRDCTRRWPWSRNSANGTLPAWDRPASARSRSSAETTPNVTRYRQFGFSRSSLEAFRGRLCTPRLETDWFFWFFKARFRSFRFWFRYLNTGI